MKTIKTTLVASLLATAFTTGVIADNHGNLPALTNDMPTDEFVIPNAPSIKPTNIITLRAIGLGVAPERAKTKAHAMALAKRAAIVDAQRQMGEKLHGIKITAKDTIKDAMIKNSVVRTQLYSIVRGGEIMETVYSDGLCQVEMEIKIDGRRWYKALANAI